MKKFDEDVKVLFENFKSVPDDQRLAEASKRAKLLSKISPQIVEEIFRKKMKYVK